jgi:hypothetical protein
VLSADEAVRIKNAALDAQRDGTTFQEAGRRLAARRNPAIQPQPLSCTASIITDAAAASILLLLLVGAIAFALARIFRRSCKQKTAHAARLGVVRHVAAWSAAYALTFVVFGLAPAEIIPPAAQAWLLAAAAALLLAAVAGWLFWRIVIRRKRTVAAVWLLLYLLLMPGLLTSGENVYQMRMVYLRNPGEYIRAMTDTMAEVRAELIQLEKKDAEP